MGAVSNVESMSGLVEAHISVRAAEVGDEAAIIDLYRFARGAEGDTELSCLPNDELKTKFMDVSQ
jgi:hypothetical protein